MAVTLDDTPAPRATYAVETAWAKYGALVLSIVAVHAALTALLRLAGAVDALLFVPDAPIDLLIRTSEVRRWFDGITIYNDPDSANYPPASYTLLWPIIGWAGDAGVRILYALSMLASVMAIAWVGVRASGVRSMAAKTFVALLVLPLGATQITVWIGQLGLHVAACLMGAAALLFGTAETRRGTRTGIVADVAAAALLAASLVKPTLSVPVVAAVLVLTLRWRPWLLTAALYLGATGIAAAFQEASTLELMTMWLGREDVMQLGLGSVNTHLWLHWLGADGSLLAVSFAWLAVLTLWTWRERHADPWLVLGVAALVGRLWIHHRAFDDVLLIIPIIALCRVAVHARGGARIAAGGLVALLYGLGHAPYAWLSGESPVLWLATEIGRTAAWLAALVFVVWHVHRRRDERAVRV